jgi:hypothetical protein
VCLVLLCVTSAEESVEDDAEFTEDWWFERRSGKEESNSDAGETNAESKTLKNKS